MWKFEARLLEVLLLAGLTLCCGRERAGRWIRPMIWGLLSLLVLGIAVLLGLIVLELVRTG